MFHAIVSLCNNHRPLVRAKLASIKFDFAYSSFIWRCVLLTNDFSSTLQLATHADNCIASPFELAVVEHTCTRWLGVCPELLRWTKCVYCGDIFLYSSLVYLGFLCCPPFRDAWFSNTRSLLGLTLSFLSVHLSFSLLISS